MRELEYPNDQDIVIASRVYQSDIREQTSLNNYKCSITTLILNLYRVLSSNI